MKRRNQISSCWRSTLPQGTQCPQSAGSSLTSLLSPFPTSLLALLPCVMELIGKKKRVENSGSKRNLWNNKKVRWHLSPLVIVWFCRWPFLVVGGRICLCFWPASPDAYWCWTSIHVQLAICLSPREMSVQVCCALWIFGFLGFLVLHAKRQHVAVHSFQMYGLQMQSSFTLLIGPSPCNPGLLSFCCLGSPGHIQELHWQIACHEVCACVLL